MNELWDTQYSATIATQLEIDDTSLVLNPGFPPQAPGFGEFFWMVVSDDTNREVLKCIGKTDADTFAVERAQHGTLARVWSVDTIVKNKVTSYTPAQLLAWLSKSRDYGAALANEAYVGSAGWTESPAGTWTHASGGGTTTVTRPLAAVIGNEYFIHPVTTDGVTGSITIQFGGVTVLVTDGAQDESWYKIRAVTTDGLVLTPTNLWEGSVAVDVFDVVEADGLAWSQLFPEGLGAVSGMLGPDIDAEGRVSTKLASNQDLILETISEGDLSNVIVKNPSDTAGAGARLTVTTTGDTADEESRLVVKVHEGGGDVAQMDIGLAGDEGNNPTAFHRYPGGPVEFSGGTRYSLDQALNLIPGNFDDVPASPTHGMIAAIDDSTTDTWGATITGGGSKKVLGFYNGTNWTVIGK